MVVRSPQIFTCFVGADSSTEKMGVRSPVFDDGTFEYIPVPERDVSNLDCKYLIRYRDVVLRSGLKVANFISIKRLNKPAHYDPEFITNTYGDYVSKPRATVLREIEEATTYSSYPD